MLRITTAVVLCLTVLAPAQAAQTAPASSKDLAGALLEQAVIPSYARLAEATTAQALAWDAGCSDVQALRDAYHQTADAWAGVFHWSYGPISLLLRRDRFYHWPERRNSTGKAVARLLAKEDPERLLPEAFSKTTVAVQGLPALERILFEDVKVAENPWACRIGATIARNLAEIAAGTLEDWQGPLRDAVASGSHPVFFESNQELLSELFTELLTGYVMIKDQKILSAMGSSAAKARPGLLETRRSERFERNLALNLKALADIETVFGQFLPHTEASRLRQSATEVKGCFDALAPFAEALYDEESRKSIKACLDVLTAHRADLAESYSQHLGLSLGFNNLDGD
ncbi:MAG: imelysin family protein [Magnetovibrionaceae bacterium]